MNNSHASEDWRLLDLSWARLHPWAPLSEPVVVSLDGIPLYGFACISSPLPVGDWTVRLTLGPVTGAARLVTADGDGQRREPRSEVIALGAEGEVLADIDVPEEFTDMRLILQKREEGSGSVAIRGVAIRPRN